MAPLKLLAHLVVRAKQKLYYNATPVASLSGWCTFYVEMFCAHAKHNSFLLLYIFRNTELQLLCDFKRYIVLT